MVASFCRLCVEGLLLAEEGKQGLKEGKERKGEADHNCIENEGEDAPGVRQGGDKGQSIHGPIITQTAGTKKKPGILCRQVEECKGSGEEGVGVGGWVVRLGEGGQAAS